MKVMILTQAIKSFIILAYYCYLHMRKLQLKKKTINKNVGCKRDSMADVDRLLLINTNFHTTDRLT